MSWWWEETWALTYLPLSASLEYKLQDAENASNGLAIVSPVPAGCSTEDRCQKHGCELVPTAELQRTVVYEQNRLHPNATEELGRAFQIPNSFKT